MEPEKLSMDRFGREWTRALKGALPPLDLDGGARALLSHRASAKPSLARSSASRRWFALAAALAFIVVVVAISGPTPGRVLALNGQSVTSGTHVTTSRAEQVLTFAEGSTIALDPESSLEVPDASEQNVAVVLGHGSARFDVVKRHATTWRIQAGPFEVKVLGTAFRVVWLPELENFTLSVTRGNVSVKGPMLGEERAVGAGTRCVVDLKGGRFAIEPNSAEASSRPSLPPAEASTEGHEEANRELNTTELVAPLQSAATPLVLERQRPNTRAGTSAPPNRPEAWRELERSGQFEQAVKAAEHSGLDAIYDLADQEDLMSLARAARFASRADVSAGALLSCRRRFPGSRNAAMSAYLLGRNAAPVDAVRWFNTYLAEAPEGSWAREAAGRLVEAHAAGGDKTATREAALKYLARYPSGPHAEFAKKVIDQ